MKSVQRKSFISGQFIEPENTNADDGDSFTRELIDLRRSLYQRALFLTQDHPAAEDLMQETLEKALVSQHRFERGSNLGAWLFSIMRNLFIDGRRRYAVQLRLEQKAPWLSGLHAKSGAPKPTAGDPGDDGISWFDGDDGDTSAGEDPSCGPLDIIAIDDVRSVVATLPPAQQKIFTLAYEDHLSYREIAGRLGIPVSTTGTRLLRVRAKVRSRLERMFQQRWRDYASGSNARS